MPGRDLVVDLARANGVAPEHEAATVARNAEAVEPHDVEIGGADRLALLQDLAEFINRAEQQPVLDLLFGEHALLNLIILGNLLDDLGDFRVNVRRAIALLVAVPALAGLEAN